METKLFLIEEHKETIFDNAEIEKWKALVDELGLENQARLIKADDSVSMIPFPVMTEAQNKIYSYIFNTHIDYKDFDGEAIPLSILSLIALCEKEKYFDRIQIWYSRENPDPLVIGKNFRTQEDKDNDYTWDMLNYLIAQWGIKIKPLIELLPLYDEFKKTEMHDNYERNLQEHQKEIEKYRFQISAFKE